MKIRVDDAARAGIKSAVRQAASILGGAKYAAAEVGLSPAQMSRIMSPFESDLPCLDTAILLDRACGAALVLAAALEAVAPPPPAPLALDDAGSLARCSGDAMQKILSALHDGRVTPGEARDLSTALGSLARAARDAKRKADHLATLI